MARLKPCPFEFWGDLEGVVRLAVWVLMKKVPWLVRRLGLPMVGRAYLSG